MSKILQATVPNTSNILSITFSDAHNAATSTAIIKAVNTSLDIGDTIAINFGYIGNNPQIMTGIVKVIEREAPENIYTITMNNDLIRAVDYFIASSSPDNPLKYQNIKAEILVKNILNKAGLTNITYGNTNFVLGTNGPFEINLVNAYDYCKQIADIVAWAIWQDKNGLIHFEDRKPYVMGGDTPDLSHYYDETDCISVSYMISERDLRNRVVVYGRGNVSATAQATSPHLPAGFFKTVVAAHPYIDTNANAQLAANYNLALLNRLTEQATIVIEGDPTLQARDIVHLTNTYAGLDHDFYVYGLEHQWSSTGFTTSLQLRK